MAEPWRSGASRRGQESRKRMAAARGEIPRCARCGSPRDRLHAYCNVCHAAYMREWRQSHPLDAEQRMKANARAVAGHAKKEGRLVPGPCARCGAEAEEMHHPDYSKPLEVIWLCRECHLALHRPEPSSRCIECGGPRDRENSSYCRACWAAYMRDYRRRKAGSRGVSRERTEEEASMIDFAEGVANALAERDFEHEATQDTYNDAGVAQEDGAHAAPASADLRAPALSPAQYLAWLAIETREALRVAEECRAGAPLVQIEDREEPEVRPLPADLPPLERRLFEVMIRMAQSNRNAALRIARGDAARREAFDPGIKKVPQTS